MAMTIRMALCAGSLLAAAGCITPDGYYRNLDGGGSGQAGAGAGTGGATGTGGAATGTGGAAMGTGGTPVTGSGGATGKGGAAGTGGAIATGGATGKGGATGTGGATATGGATGTAGAPGTGLFSDNFENGSSKWMTNSLGTAAITSDGSNVYDLSYPMSKVLLAGAGDPAWTDVIVQARIKIVSFNGSNSSSFAGLCARVEDANNYYCVVLRGDGSVSIRGDIGGSSNSIGSSNSYGVTTGTWYTVQLEVVGSTITASINATPVLPKPGASAITNSSLPSGGIALAVDNAEAEFDDVSVMAP